MIHYTPIFPRLSGLPLAGRAISATPRKDRSPTLSRGELRRLIAEMID